MKLPTLNFNPLAILIAVTLFIFLPIIYALYGVEAWGGGGKSVLSLIANILLGTLVFVLAIEIAFYIRNKRKLQGMTPEEVRVIKSEVPTRRGRLTIAWFVTLFMILGGLNGLRMDNKGLEVVDGGWLLTLLTPIIIIWVLYFVFKPKA